MNKSNKPAPITHYVLYTQRIHDDGSHTPWEPTIHISTEMGEIEALAERLTTNQNPRWMDRGNYAVVKVTRKAVRIFDAPMRAAVVRVAQEEETSP